MDVLDNVPSVEVNIEGQISLRGNAGVQILINGKPSVLASDESNALGTIPRSLFMNGTRFFRNPRKYNGILWSFGTLAWHLFCLI